MSRALVMLVVVTLYGGWVGSVSAQTATPPAWAYPMNTAPAGGGGSGQARAHSGLHQNASWS